MSLESNFRKVQAQLAEALQKSNRRLADVLILAVTKNFSVDQVRAAYDLGLRNFGENYVQEALPKMAEFAASDLRWHFIGHLQTNKVKSMADHFSLIHSVDSLKLGEEIHKRSTRKQKILIEVNLAGESSKSGVAAGLAPNLLGELQKLDQLQISGLMFMPPLGLNEEARRQYFDRARALFLLLKSQSRTPAEFRELSMGTSHDYLIAVEYGATIIRLGTALFGERNYE